MEHFVLTVHLSLCVACSNLIYPHRLRSLLLLLFLLALSDLTDSHLPPFFQGVLLFVVNLLYARILSVMHGFRLQIFLC